MAGSDSSRGAEAAGYTELMGSARVSRAGDCVLAIANFPSECSMLSAREINEKIVLVRHQNQHARRPFNFAQGRQCATPNAGQFPTSFSHVSPATLALLLHRPTSVRGHSVETAATPQRPPHEIIARVPSQSAAAR